MTLHYPFPHIANISDVLPAIEGCPEFVVVKKDAGITLVNYVLSGSETFPPVLDEAAAIRRECRGIIFDTETGALLSRRLHKFFNLGERGDVSYPDLRQPHSVLEKLDGSMVTPIRVPSGGLRWGTKMGITDVSMQAECFVAQHPEYVLFAETCEDYDCTPIFEWCSNQQRIVVDQPVDRLVLLHVRQTFSGEYFNRSQVAKLGEDFNIPVVHQLPTLKDWEDHGSDEESWIRSIREQEDAEGVVVCFQDGHMLKIKSDWYVSLHRARSKVEQHARHIVKLILENGLDDLIPMLPPDDVKRLDEFQTALLKDMNTFDDRAHGLKVAAEDEGVDRRGFQMWATARNVPRPLVSGVFHLFNETGGLIQWLTKFILDNCVSNSSYEKKVKPILVNCKWKEREI